MISVFNLPKHVSRNRRTFILMLSATIGFLLPVEKRALIHFDGNGRNVVNGLTTVIKYLQRVKNVLRHNTQTQLNYNLFFVN